MKTQDIRRCAALGIAFALVLTGCATTRARHVWTDDALHAETLQAHGELDEARKRYEELLPLAPNDERRRWMKLNMATLEIEAGHTDRGQAMLAELYDDPINDLYGANALYESAKLADRHGDSSLARDRRLATIRRYPTQIAAEFALSDIVNRESARGEENAAAYRELHQTLLEIFADVEQTELGDNVLFEIAVNLRTNLGQPDEALEAYRTLYRNYRKGPLADDALWEIAEIYRDHQMWRPAAAALQILADEQEESWFVGSYDSDWVDDAIFDLGMIHLLYLDDYSTAIAWFERYLKDFPLGLLNDDAAWNIVQAYRLSGDDRYEPARDTFVETFPESRYVRRVEQTTGGHVDPG